MKGSARNKYTAFGLLLVGALILGGMILFGPQSEESISNSEQGAKADGLRVTAASQSRSTVARAGNGAGMNEEAREILREL